MYIYIYMYISICICIYLYIYKYIYMYYPSPFSYPALLSSPNLPFHNDRRNIKCAQNTKIQI